MEKYGRAEELDTAATGITVDPTPVTIDKYGTAEEEYITSEHMKAYEDFVTKVQAKYELETREQADAKAQELIRDYQKREHASKDGRSM